MALSRTPLPPLLPLLLPLLLLLLALISPSSATNSDWRVRRAHRPPQATPGLPYIGETPAGVLPGDTGRAAAMDPHAGYAGEHGLLREEALRGHRAHRDNFNYGAEGHTTTVNPGGVSGGWGFSGTGNPHARGGRFRTS